MATGAAAGAERTTGVSRDTMVDKLGNKIWRTDTSKAGEMTPEKVTQMIQDVTDDDVSSTISYVDSITSDVKDRMEFSIFDFVGFDPMVIVKVLKAYQKHYNEGNEDLMSDIRFQIAAVLYMGNLQTKAMTRRALEGRTKIEYLIQKYNIRTGSTGAGIPAEALTFPRIAASFPSLAIKMAVNLPPSAASLEFMGRKVPPCMRLTPFASLCSPNMDDDLRLFLMEACNAHGSDMALVYERGRCKKNKIEFKPNVKATAEDQWAFVEVAADSIVPLEETKKSILIGLNLPQYHKDLSEVVANYRTKVFGKEVKPADVLSAKAFEDLLSKYTTSTST